MQRGWVEGIENKNCSVVQIEDNSTKGAWGEGADILEVQFPSLVTD